MWVGPARHGFKTAGDEQKLRNADWLKENHLDKGLLGVKSGEGFYKYPDPEFAKPEFPIQVENMNLQIIIIQ